MQMLTTPRSFSLVILLALLVSLILATFGPAIVLAASQPKTQATLCSDQDTMLLIEFNPSQCHYGARMP
jgi:hypothetical protein